MANSIFIGSSSAPLVLSGGQITFPPALGPPLISQYPSSDPNTLDDYNEFAWTPTIGGSTSQSGQAYSIQDGRGIKIGQLVFCWARIQLSTLGTITGSVQIQSLPYAGDSLGSSSIKSSFIGSFSTLTSTFVELSGIMAGSGATVITLQKLTAAGTATSTVAQTDLANTTLFDFGMIYRASQ